MQAILLDTMYLPPVQYLSKFLLYDEILIEASSNFQKGSYRNRCRIVSANGLLDLSIPLMKGKNEQMPIRDTRIENAVLWQKQHWQALCSAYNKSPYFFYYKDYFNEFYQNKPTFLLDWNMELLDLILKLLKITTPTQQKTIYEKALTDSNVIDARGSIMPQLHRSSSDVHFQAQPYPQVFEDRFDFQPNVSIIDMLCCCGPSSKQYLSNCLL